MAGAMRITAGSRFEPGRAGDGGLLTFFSVIRPRSGAPEPRRAFVFDRCAVPSSSYGAAPGPLGEARPGARASRHELEESFDCVLVP